MLISVSAVASCSPGWVQPPASAEASWAGRCYRIEGSRSSLSECIQACDTFDAAPVCVSMASEMSFIKDLVDLTALEATAADYVGDLLDSTLEFGMWLGAYRKWSGDGTNDGHNAFDYRCVTGGSMPFANWEKGVDWERSFTEPEALPAPENATLVQNGQRMNDADCILLSKKGRDENWLDGRQFWQPTLCNHWRYHWHPADNNGQYPCMCAINAGTATAESIADLRQMSERDQAFRGKIVTTMLVNMGAAWAWGTILCCVGVAVTTRCGKQRGRVSRSGASESDAARAQAESLQKMQRVATQMRMRVKWALILTGSLLITLALGNMAVLVASFRESSFLGSTDFKRCGKRCATAPLFGHPLFWLGLLGPGVSSMLLAVFPTDTRTIRATNYLFVVVLSVGVWNFWSAAALHAIGTDSYGGDAYTASHVVYTGCAVIFTVVDIYLIRGLPLGCCCPSYALPPRLALSRIWKAYRVGMLAVGLCFVSLSVWDVGISIRTVHTQSTLAMMLGLAMPALTLTRRNCGRIHRCLMELTSPKGTAEQEAAAVAALLGGGSASTALALGQELFRSLPLSALREADLGTSKNTGLHEKTMRATLGEVDAFMSHSWSDPGDLKFAALNDWGTRFIEQGRDASIWLGEYSRNSYSNPRPSRLLALSSPLHRTTQPGLRSSS